MDTVDHFDYVIFEEDIREQMERKSYRFETVSLNWDPKLIGDMLRGILNRNYPQVLDQNGKRYYWGEKD